MEVCIAFFNRHLQKVVYMALSKGFIVSSSRNFVYKLKKSLNGLKQSNNLLEHGMTS